MKKTLLALIIGPLIIGCSSSKPGSTSPDHSSAILGGEVVQKGQYRAQSSVIRVYTYNKEGGVSGQCTAVLIAKNVAVTAAHCLEARDTFVSFNAVYGLTPHDLRALRGGQFALHPRYMTEPLVASYTFTNPPSEVKFTMNRRFDIAIFSFKGNLPREYRPAQIDTDLQIDRSGELVYAYGTGGRLHPYQITSNQDMLTMFDYLTRGTMLIYDYKTYEDFYLTSEKSANHTCEGDSGGPQFLANAKEPTVTGLHSARLNNSNIEKHKATTCGDASVITKVAPFASWILEKKVQFEKEL